MVLNKRDLENAFSPTKGRIKRKIDHRATLNRRQPLAVVSSTQNDQTVDVKVFIRIRPFSEKEKSENKDSRSTIKIIDDKMLIFDPKADEDAFFFRGQLQKGRDLTKRVNKNLEFIFDEVFPPNATNQQVHVSTTKNIVASLLDGFNCSVFVYGATGAGKTHTMLGNKDNPGITFLTMVELYEQVEKLSDTKDFDLRVSYLEVYNEIVYDLLQSKFTTLYLRDDGMNGLSISGLKVVQIQNAAELFEMLEFGNKNRTQHPTDSNAESSRSHAVFQVYLKMCSKQNTEKKIAKLSMIDLAGSERGSATGCTGSRFKEGSNINKSLLALGNCINNLADGLKHIPYRDSKLTRILKDSLGGNCQTIMIANVSPSNLSYEDTYNTLKYASRAKKIKTKFTTNVSTVNMRIEHYVRLMDEMKRENLKLKNQVKALEAASNKPQAKLTPPTADPKLVEQSNLLFAERKKLQTTLMMLESHEKTFEWRIRHKQIVIPLLGMMDQEKDKVQRTITQLEARASSVHEKIKEVLKKYKHHDLKFNEHMKMVDESKTKQLLKDKFDSKHKQIQLAIQGIQGSHYQKIILMQDQQLSSNNLVIKKLLNLSSTFYSIIRGHNLLTSSLKNDYESVESMLEGVKSVTWNDIDNTLDEEAEITLSHTSVKPFMNLTILNATTENVPKATEQNQVDNAVPVQNALSSCPAVTSNSENIQPQTSSIPANIVTKLTPMKNHFNVNLKQKENVNTLASNLKRNLEIASKLNGPLKPQGERIPLNTLKMARVNSRISRAHHPYSTSKSRLGLSTRNIKSSGN